MTGLLHSLRSKIFGFFLVLLSFAMVLVLVLVQRTTYAHTVDQLEAQLAAGFRIFAEQTRSRRQYQTSMTTLVTQDFGLRSEIASFAPGDSGESLRVVLDNFRMRSDANMALVAAPDGTILASTAATFAGQTAFPLPGILHEGSADHDALLVAGQSLLQLFAIPVYAPKPNLLAWFVLGYRIDDQYAVDLATLTGLDVAFVQTGRGATAVLASSVPVDRRSAIGSVADIAEKEVAARQVDDREVMLFAATIDERDGRNLRVVLYKSLTEALRDFTSMQWNIALIVLLALIFSASGAFIIAGSVTRPLETLVAYVRRIGAGDYGARPPEHIEGEFGVLTHEFAAMQAAVAERQAKIEHDARHDTLTQLPNRIRFQQLLQEAIERCGPSGTLATLVLGLDHFKEINDTLGHAKGDGLLVQVARRLAGIVREGDHLARLGGDTFAVLVTGIERHDLINATLHYKQAFAEPYPVEGFSMAVNASIGIATYPEHGESPALLLQRTEIAMYVCKEKRLPYALYSDVQNRYNLLRLSLMSELKGAISRGEMVLHFQPKLNLASNTASGVECLVRWQHPVHGFVRPDDFIPLAEQTGNIVHLTSWALDTAMAQNRRWRDQGFNLTTAVNVSVVDLQDPALLDRIDDLLLKHRLPPGSLVLEITESGIMNDVDKAVALLSRMQQRGLRLSIDDYGTGYSSMAQLKRLPVHELKIDKSFILDLARNEDDAIIVRSTIELGHNMGLKIVAEGVEGAEALEMLRSFGCEYAQGYHLGRPVDAAALERWLRDCPYGVQRVGSAEGVPQ